MKKGIRFSDITLSEEDKKKTEELGKPKLELTPEQMERKKAKKERKKQNAQKNKTSREPYLISLFKMKDKLNWRMSVENPFPKPENLTEIKTIKIDRITGEVI